ncbi:hypothetical protein [Pararhodobacter sp.]|uniref:hypothetical protein n=1 Tax=Pararhodobacter sp. TaxID=2127056 RepID=UPI002AFDCC18|nr:hypothetical protein [Pararhodobacter sp.]
MRISTLTQACVLAAGFPGLAIAQAITDCEWIGNPANIVEPWDVNSRTFANGNIRVAWLDTGGEPVCCSSHLLILSPSGNGADEPIYRQCRVASAQPGQGFYAVDVPGISASYDPNKGLLLSVPISHWHQGMENGAGPIPDRMEIRINQANGAVVFE